MTTALRPAVCLPLNWWLTLRCPQPVPGSWGDFQACLLQARCVSTGCEFLHGEQVGGNDSSRRAERDWKLRRQFYQAVKNRKTAFFLCACLYGGMEKEMESRAGEKEPWPPWQILESPAISHTPPHSSPSSVNRHAMCSEHLLYEYAQHSFSFLG